MASHFIPFNPPCESPKVDSFKDLELPQFRTVNIVGIELRKVDSINYKNDNGQVINLARSTGTDKQNARGIEESLLNQGWDTTQIPPIVDADNDTLYDGFTRQEVLIKLEQQEAPYLVVKVKDGYTTDDVIDEVGLGANNHSQSKSANMADFKTRFKVHVTNQENAGKTVSLNDGIQWFNSIPHSFDEARVVKAIESVFSSINALKNMESFTKTSAQKKAAELLEVPSSSVLAIGHMSSGHSTTIKRALWDALCYFDKHGTLPKVVGFLDQVESEDSEEKRKLLDADIKRINNIFKGLVPLYKQDPDFDVFNFKGFVPQVIDVETDIIN